MEIALDVKNLARKLAPSLPVPEKKGTHKGKILLSPEKIKSIRRQAVAEVTKEKELRGEYPQLEVFPMEGYATLNETKLNLEPAAEEIKKDVSLFMK